METELLRDLNPVPVEPNGMDMGRMAQFFNQDRTDEQAGFLQSFTTEFITDATTGRVFEVLARPAGFGGNAATPLWDLDIRQVSGAWKIAIGTPGTIRTTSALDSAVGITSISTEFTVSGAGYLYLKVDDEMEVSLHFGAIPSDPELWEVTEVSAGYGEFVAHYYPLWRVHDIADGVDGVDFGDYTAVQYASSANFQMYNVRWENPDGLICSVIQLMESYRGYAP